MWRDRYRCNWLLGSQAPHPRWKDLARMALEYLIIPAMSAEPERVFSGAKIAASDRRCRLRDDAINALECLKSWDQRRPARQTGNAPPQIPRTSPAGDVGREVAGNQAVGRISHHWEEIPILLCIYIPNMGG